MKPLTRSRWLLILIVMVILVIGLLTSNPPETPLQRAYRICWDCGLVDYEVDQLIENAKLSTLTPEEQIELWLQVAEPDAVELCLPYAEAVVEVVE